MAELKVKKVKEQAPAEEDAKAELAGAVEAKDVKAPVAAKAGKRSAKSLAEAEEKQEKEARKTEAVKPQPETPKQQKTPAKSRLERAGKKYREVAKLVDKEKSYSLAEALELATKTTTTKFDATVELHVNLGVDPKQADQNVRGTVSLPAGTGKNIKIAVFAEADDAAKAKAAGAEIAGIDEIIALLDKEQLDFDVLISSPTLMARLGKYARLLGPRGLMPSPKSGTVAINVSQAVAEAKAGKVEYRVDQAGIIHLGIGKVSFGAEKLVQNAETIMASIRSAKPSSVKANYIKSITVSTTMGPGIKVDTSSKA